MPIEEARRPSRPPWRTSRRGATTTGKALGTASQPIVRVTATTTDGMPDTGLAGVDTYMHGVIAFAQAVVPGSATVIASVGDERNAHSRATTYCLRPAPTSCDGSERASRPSSPTGAHSSWRRLTPSDATSPSACRRTAEASARLKGGGRTRRDAGQPYFHDAAGDRPCVALLRRSRPATRRAR
jgi:hypothetical protein